MADRILEDECWVPVPGYEGLYSVSNLGRVRSEPRVVERPKVGNYLLKGRTLRPFKSKSGYLLYDLRKANVATNHYGHALVLSAFHGPRPVGYDSCHNNGIRSDNRASNLRWDTRRENCKDKVKHGTAHKGEGHPAAKLTEDDVRNIRVDKRPSSLLASIYGVNFGTICAIRRNERWAHVS